MPSFSSLWLLSWDAGLLLSLDSTPKLQLPAADRMIACHKLLAAFWDFGPIPLGQWSPTQQCSKVYVPEQCSSDPTRNSQLAEDVQNLKKHIDTIFCREIAIILPSLEAQSLTAAPTNPTHEGGQASVSPGDSFPAESGNQSVTPANPAPSDAENKTMAAAYGVAVSSTVTGIYSVVGTIGNGLVILTFCTYRQVRTSAHTIILSISISDVIITGFQYPVSTASGILGAPSLGHAMCPMIGALFYFSIYISLLSMVLIAFNRCIRVTKSTETYRRLFGPSRSFLWVLLSWVVSGLLVVPGFLGYGEFGWNKNSQICALMDNSSYSRDYVSNVYGLFYLIVFCVVIGIYLRIYLFVNDSVVTMAAANQNIANHEKYVSQRVIQRTKHMLLIFGVFTVCSAPSVLLFSINVHKDFLPQTVIVVSFMLYRLNYVLNPFLYAWKLPVFRRAFKAIVRCKRQLPFQAGAPVN
uniref:G-protein coupled receptors family 1 profile domain-containing protein n=1 Tax=Branchiostoma floridae TaxID=7739 RepID=C3YAF9_BRAFL|eukprot:XP_002606697.1 hypothetical protein BRAFLDRAFT_72536 [Branchiostoma floridae]